jgi:16S rRNA (adenine1518-N6/adenine1519-N6)-dimethyltransferase
MEMIHKPALGQHWLNDSITLDRIADAALLSTSDTVLEIGPGLGSLTEKIVTLAKKTIAVELDAELIDALKKKFDSAQIEIINQDILKFDLEILPEGYKIVANIPYYLTSHLIRKLCESDRHFSRAVILVQKEIAQRITASPGALSILGLTTQFYCEVSKDQVIPAALFMPPPKVDSQVLILDHRNQPLFPDVKTELFFRIIKAGFSQKRKTLVNSLSGGLNLDKSLISKYLINSDIEPGYRAQVLSLDDWHRLYIKLSPLLANT